MSYVIPKNIKIKSTTRHSVMFRIPKDIKNKFNEALSKSNLSAQKLIADMVRHCLKGTK